jgi:hypothetical protein
VANSYISVEPIPRGKIHGGSIFKRRVKFLFLRADNRPHLSKSFGKKIKGSRRESAPFKNIFLRRGDAAVFALRFNLQL